MPLDDRVIRRGSSYEGREKVNGLSVKHILMYQIRDDIDFARLEKCCSLLLYLEDPAHTGWDVTGMEDH